MTYEVRRWLPAIVKAVAVTFSAWSLSRRQAASTKQVVLQALFMWTGNDIGHANWWTHIYHASARVGQLILKQALNIQATENEIMSCDVNIQICWYICYSWKHECFHVLNVLYDLSYQLTMYENNERCAVWWVTSVGPCYFGLRTWAPVSPGFTVLLLVTWLQQLHVRWRHPTPTLPPVWLRSDNELRAYDLRLSRRQPMLVDQTPGTLWK